jgi:hypothetical protein
MSKYKDASLETFKLVKVFSIQIIQTKMTLICYQLATSQKWKAYECCSADMPLEWTKRKSLLPVLEMFGFLYYQMLEQEQIFQRLADETLGLTVIDGQTKVAALLEAQSL